MYFGKKLRLGLLLCVPLGSLTAGAAGASGANEGGKAIQPATADELRSVLPGLRALVAACARDSAACDAAKVGSDLRVNGGRGYEVHWDWLRDALTAAHDNWAAHDNSAAKGKLSAERLRAADDRLLVMGEELAAPAASDAEAFDRARTQADKVLAEPKFDRQGPTWWERLKARFFRWLYKLFEGVSRVGALAPWLGETIEWTLFVGAVVVLVVLLLRNVARQRLRMAMGAAAPLQSAWDHEAEDWRRLAEAAATRGEWREAIHCLYWAAIVLLEGRRAWRHDPTRTAREYVRLLKRGSVEREQLGSLTRTFEGVWYGYGQADGAVYEGARRSFGRLDEPSRSPNLPASGQGEAA